jgi:hypothetical protein
MSNESHRTAKEQQQLIWLQLKEKLTGNTPLSPERKWPSYYDVLSDVKKTDYHQILSCPADIHPLEKDRNKTICPQGAVCCARLELFTLPEESGKMVPYSGLLTPNTTAEYCIMRLSSALQPLDTSGRSKKLAKVLLGNRLVDAKLFPAVAIKLFRDNGVESGNMLFMGCKVGQEEDSFFAHCLSTQITSSMPATLKPILHLFKKYSKDPLLLGNSNLCAYNSNGEMSMKMNFPFCLTLKPRVEAAPTETDRPADNRHEGTPITQKEKEKAKAKQDHSKSKPVDSFLDDILEVPPGTVLYDLFASPDPLSVVDGRKLQRIGRVVTTSEMIRSTPKDGLFFRHQRKEEDFDLKPEWKKDLDTPLVLRNGRKGSIASVTGWKLFEQQIKEGGYTDFELC